MIDENCNALFALLRAGLWKKEVTLLPYGKIDYDLVLHLAEEQSIVGHVAVGLKHLVDTKPHKVVALQFIGRAVIIEQINQAMNYFIGTTVEKMSRAGLKVLLLKGQGVAQCYEHPLLRSCGDVDFFLSDEDYEKAKALLIPLATNVETEYVPNKHLGMTIGSWVVELHGSLRMGLPKNINQVLDEIINDTFGNGNMRSWDNGSTRIFMLSKESDVVYVFVHFFNHFYKGGLGLKQICDWCRLLWTYRESIDVQMVESRITRMGLVSEWKAFAAFAVDYLGMPVEAMPMFDDAKKWKRKAERIKDFVMSVGSFGRNRDMNYFGKYPYLVRKCISMSQRVGDLVSHSRIFPLDSLRFFPRIIFNGLRSAMRGE